MPCAPPPALPELGLDGSWSGWICPCQTFPSLQIGIFQQQHSPPNPNRELEPLPFPIADVTPSRAGECQLWMGSC